MALDTFLLELLVDPSDHGSLRYFQDRAILVNPRTKKVYDIRNEIPVLLTTEARELTADEQSVIDDASRYVNTGSPQL